MKRVPRIHVEGAISTLLLNAYPPHGANSGQKQTKTGEVFSQEIASLNLDHKGVQINCLTENTDHEIKYVPDSDT